MLNNLGLAFADLGEAFKAIEYYKQALVIDREVGNRKDEGKVLNNLGSAYHKLGEMCKAIEFHVFRVTSPRLRRLMCGRSIDLPGSAHFSLGLRPHCPKP